MKRLSLQWRITLMSVLLIGITCVAMNLLLCSSGVYYMDTIADSLQGGGTVILNEGGAASFDPQLVAPSEELTIVVDGAQGRFRTTNWYITAAVTVFGGALAYFLSGHALKPLRTFTSQVEKVQLNNLTDMKINEDVLPEFRQFSRSVTDEAGGAVLYLLLYIGLLLPTLFVCELFRRSATPLANLGATLLGVLYVAVPLSLLLYVPVLAGDGVWRPETVLCYIFIIWANDVFAYLVGMTFGRHRLCERLSPKKSWEGFFGGLAGAVATGLAAAYALDANYWVWGGLALVASLSGVAGDLVESMFKREAGVKDSGQVIPGHGGVLDRFDALLLSAPYVFLYLLLVGRFV